MVKVLFLCFFLGTMIQGDQFKLGIENMSPSQKLVLQSSRVALFTNQTGKTSKGISNIAFLNATGIAIKKILVPEHGFDGLHQASQEIFDTKDQGDHPPLISMYGKGTGKKIDESIIGDVDVIVIDIQDSGMRHYTYLSSMYHILEAAQRYQKSVMVFDRPNPLGCVMTGPLVQEGLQSFISIAPIPWRHGMTLGELALYFNEHFFDATINLLVVPMAHYTRTMGLPSYLPATLSPNIACHNACYGYSFLGILGEIRPFDVGIGTDHAFQGIFLESKKYEKFRWHELQQLMESWGIRTSLYTYFNKRKKRFYSGLRTHIADINSLNSWHVLCSLLHYFKRKGVDLRCSDSFDKALGTDKVQKWVMNGRRNVPFSGNFSSDLADFHTKAQKCYLYEPWPRFP